MPMVTPAADLTARLGRLTLPEAGGGTVVLSSLWADRPVVLVHLRHFG